MGKEQKAGNPHTAYQEPVWGKSRKQEIPIPPICNWYGEKAESRKSPYRLSETGVGKEQKARNPHTAYQEPVWGKSRKQEIPIPPIRNRCGERAESKKSPYRLSETGMGERAKSKKSPYRLSQTGKGKEQKARNPHTAYQEPVWGKCRKQEIPIPPIRNWYGESAESKKFPYRLSETGMGKLQKIENPISYLLTNSEEMTCTD